ncbi:hypothetical protein RhiirC2_802432, partial [Rhizophagus irregularis]
MDDNDYRFYTDGSVLNFKSSSVSTGLGWVQVDSDDFIVAHCSSSIRSDIPSSLRAELQSILSILEQLPNSAEILIFTDAQAIISSAPRVLSSEFSLKQLRKKNYVLWSYFRSLIFQKNLRVSFSKVAAHSDNDLNNRADFLAKDHLNSSSIYEPDISRLQDTLPMIPCFNNIQVDLDLRSLVKTRYEQIQFLNFCSLQRFARQSVSASLYSWKAIWGFFRFSLYHGASTNFKDHNFTIFRLKILFDRLPTLCL